MANYTSPLILTVGSKGLGTAVATPTVAGTDTKAAVDAGTAAYLDDLLIGTSDNDVIAGLALTALSAGVAFLGVDGDGIGGVNTMEGGAGDDQYIVNDQNDVVTELVGEGNNDTVFTAVSYTLKDNVENIVAFGSAGITITGNKLGNLLDGSQTNAKSDTLVGVEGDDVYIIGGTTLATQDKVFETIKSGGTDTIVSNLVGLTLNIDISKDSNQIKGATNIENVILTDTATGLNVTGNALNNRLVGNGGVNKLIGNDGNDTLDGGVEGTEAIDDLQGGRGNDTYIVRNSSDVILELSNSGTDTVRSSATYTIDGTTTTTGQNVEHITLLGSTDINATGNALANQLVGNSGANALTGGANNDTLTGNQGNDVLTGGIGNDSMTGGKGNDSYVVDATGDKVIETDDDKNATQGGDDLVTSSITYTLPVNVEKLTLSGSANINATGNTLDNTIIGNTGNNSINGGIGDDTMTGGTGNDTYTIDSTDDSVVEVTGGGADTIMSNKSLTAAKTAFVETVILTGIDAIDAAASNSFDTVLGVTVIGNDVDNAITGGTGADTLKGDTSSTGTKGGIDTIVGGAGADTLYGYGGDDQLNGETDADTLYGGEGNDTLTEADTTGGNTLNGDKGNDTISSGVGADSLNGGDGDDVITTGDTAGDTVTGGVGNDTVTGGSGTDSISGDAGNDVIVGAAGADIIAGSEGNDTITGGAAKDVIDPGAGNDTLIFASGITDTFTGGLVANIDAYANLSLKANTGDLIDLTVSVARVGAAVAGTLNFATDGDFVTSMNTLLNASGVGFDTATAGITAAVVTDSGTSRKFLAVDIDTPANSAFTAADFVIELTGTTTSFTNMTTATFV